MIEKEPIIKPEEEIKEIKEKEPEMRLKFFFSPHYKKEDYAKLREEIKNCDVYIPELFRHDPETLDSFRKISLGELSPEEFIRQYEEKYSRKFPDHYKEKLRILHNSKKAVYLVDIPQGHIIDLKMMSILELNSKAFIDFLSGNFSSAVTKGKKFAEFFEQVQQEREKYIKENIERLKPQILKDHPDFKNQKEIKLLVSLGATHTSLFHQFRKEGKIPTQWEFSSLPIIYDLTSALRRKKRFFPRKETEDKKIAQSFIEEMVFRALKRENIKDTTELFKIARYFVSTFSEKDVENFSRMLKERHPMLLINLLLFASTTGSETSRLFSAPLKEWGVNLPETREEVEKIIKKAEKKG